jgi:hypothetical protein
MSQSANRRLDALLADFVPPAVPAGLAERVAAAALAQPQAAAPSWLRRIAGGGRNDRRGRWARRPLIVGAAAFGLAVSSAVAATLAGVNLPPRVEKVLAEIPFVGRLAKPEAPPVERAEPTVLPPVTAVAPAPVTDAAPAGDLAEQRLRRAQAVRRLAAARQVVEARRAAGLPTPRADRIESAIERRRATEASLTPEQRQRRAIIRERIRANIEARRAAREAGAPAQLLVQPPPVPEDGTNMIGETPPVTVPDAEIGNRIERPQALRDARWRRLRERRDMRLAEGDEGFSVKSR